MKTIGIVIRIVMLLFGYIFIISGIIRTIVYGIVIRSSFANVLVGVTFIVLGAFLISRANKKNKNGEKVLKVEWWDKGGDAPR
jgi:hypothetical protein